VACQPVDDPEEERIFQGRIENTGVACASDDDLQLTVEAGDQVELLVDLEGSGEYTIEGRGCTVTPDGDQLVIDAWVEVKQTPEQQDASTDTPLFTACTTPVLEEGTYWLVYAGQQVPLDVPSTGEAVCTSDGVATAG